MFSLKISTSPYLLITALGLTASAGFAGTMGNAPVNRYVAALSLGPVWQSAGTTQTFYLAPEVEKTYNASKSSNALLDGELFLGMQRPINERLQGQLGLALAAAGNAKLKGDIWDDADPQFNNYTYSYKVRHVHLALKGKLLADMGYLLMPWIDASLGVASNRAYDFNNTPTIFEAIPNANFSSNSKTAFNYTLGIGVQKVISQHWQAGLGYQFADWGKSGLGRAVGQTVNSGLKLNHLYTNGVLFNLSYVA